jgi:hypothetical protein
LSPQHVLHAFSARKMLQPAMHCPRWLQYGMRLPAPCILGNLSCGYQLHDKGYQLMVLHGVMYHLQFIAPAACRHLSGQRALSRPPVHCVMNCMLPCVYCAMSASRVQTTGASRLTCSLASSATVQQTMLGTDIKNSVVRSALHSMP